MEHVTAGQEWLFSGDTPVAAAVAGVVVVGEESPTDTDLGELDLLAAAWADAMAAHAEGLVLGADDVQVMTAAAMEARRRDTVRMAETTLALVGVGGGAA